MRRKLALPPTRQPEDQTTTHKSAKVSLNLTAGAKADAIFLYNPQLTNRAPLAQRGCNPGHVSHNGSLVLLLQSQHNDSRVLIGWIGLNVSRNPDRGSAEFGPRSDSGSDRAVFGAGQVLVPNRLRVESASPQNGRRLHKEGSRPS